MTIIPQQLIALLPLLIIGLTVVIVMLSIAWRRNHFFNTVLSVVGLNTALISLWFVDQVIAIDVTQLIRVDGYSVLYTSLVLLASLASCIFAYSWLKNYDENQEEFYLLVLIIALGGILLVNTNHLVTLFLGIELVSLPLFGLIGYVFRQKNSIEASIKYTILSAVASSFLLFGMALLYAQTGNLSFVALGKSLSDNKLYEPLLLASLGMMTIGLSFKLSLAPFHLWTPDVYQGAPAPVSALLATVSKSAIFVAIVRFFFYTSITDREAFRLILSIIAFVSMIFGNLMALSQTNIKRLLGYSSISHLGYLLVALIALQNSKISIETVGVYLIGYLFSSLGAFGVISLMSNLHYGSDTDAILFYRGLFWHQPILSIVMTIMMLSLSGIPMTLGFIGKFYILTIGVQAHLWWLIAGVVISSAIGLCYYLRVTVNLYLSAPRQLNYDVPHNWQCRADGILVIIFALLLIIFGVYPQPLINIIQRAAPIM